MNPIFKEMMKEAFNKSVRQGGTTFLEELAETLAPDQIRSLIGTLEKVLKRKVTTIDVHVKR